MTDAPKERGDLKALVTEIINPGNSFISVRESYAYVRRAEAVLLLLAQACERDAKAGLALADHALRRVWSAINDVDDSDGNVGELCRVLRGYELDGRTAEALALRRRQFDASPSVATYHAVLKAANAAGQDENSMRADLTAALIAAEENPSSPADTSLQRWTRTPARVSAPDVSLRAEVLGSEGR